MTAFKIRGGPLTQKLQGLYKRLTGRTLLAFFGVTLGLWGFLTIAGEMSEGETRAFDQYLLLALRTPGDPSNPIGPRWFEESMRDITALGGFTVLTLLTLTTVVALLRSGRKLEAAMMATTVIGAELSSDLLKLAYARPRPMLVPHESYVYSNSFPSGHSAVSAATYLMLALLLANAVKRRQSRAMIYSVAILIIVAVGVSRAYLGVHWPTDVLAGWALGGAWAILGWIFFGFLHPSPSTPSPR